MGIGGLRSQSIVMENVYRFPPSPVYFYLFTYALPAIYCFAVNTYYLVPILFRKLRASTKSCDVNNPLPVHPFIMSVNRWNTRWPAGALTRPQNWERPRRPVVRLYAPILRCEPPTTRDSLWWHVIIGGALKTAEMGANHELSFSRPQRQQQQQHWAAAENGCMAYRNRRGIPWKNFGVGGSKNNAVEHGGGFYSMWVVWWRVSHGQWMVLFCWWWWLRNSGFEVASSTMKTSLSMAIVDNNILQ